MTLGISTLDSQPADNRCGGLSIRFHGGALNSPSARALGVIAVGALAAAAAHYGSPATATSLAPVAWPAAGCAAAILLRWGRRAGPEAAAAILGASVAIIDTPILVAPRVALDVVATAVTVLLVRRSGTAVDELFVRPATALPALAALVLPAAGAGAAVGLLDAWNRGSEVAATAVPWAAAGVAGACVLAPAILVAPLAGPLPPRRRLVEASALAASTIALAGVVAAANGSLVGRVPFFPLLAWAALRFQHVGSALFVALVGFVFLVPWEVHTGFAAREITLLALGLAAVTVGSLEAERKRALDRAHHLVDEQRRANDDAEGARSTVARILGTISDPFVAFDEELRLIYANDRAIEAGLVTPEGTVGELLAEAVRDQTTPIHHHIARALVRKELVRFDWEPRGSGARFDVCASSAQGVVSVHFRDVTAERRATRQLAASERRYRELTEASFDLVAVFDERLRPLELNPRWEEITGVPTADLLASERLTTLLTRDSREALHALAAAVGDAQQPHGRTLELLVDDGSSRQIEMTARRIETDDGRLLVYAVGRDITERTRLSQRLAEAQRLEAVGRLAGGIAHDFNNLLLVVAGYTDLLSRVTQGQVRRDVDEIATAARQGRVLVRRLLAFAGRQVMTVEVLDLNDVVLATDELLRPLIGEDVELKTEFAPAPALIQADRGQVEQVIVNLALNARQAIPQGGTISVVVGRTDLTSRLPAWGGGRPGEYVTLTVRDTGVGIPPHLRSHIFEPFFSTKGGSGGSGLGLATVYGVVTQFGGGIDLESRPGQGAAFTIYLPAAPASVSPPTSSLARPYAAHPRDAALPGLDATVLVVEDEDAARRYIERALAEVGCRVFSAASGDEALSLVLGIDESIDLLLTDIVMPTMSGPELARRFLEIQPRTPVAYMTGYSERAVELRERLGGVALLEKPFERGELIDVVSGAVEQREEVSANGGNRR